MKHWCIKKILIIILVLSGSLISGSSYAIGVKIQPSEINIEARIGEIARSEIIIENPSNNVALFEIYSDDFSDLIKISPESFTLQSKESQKVILSARPGEAGIFSTRISAVAKPLSDRQFKTGSGIKIPLEIRVSDNPNKMLLAGISFALINKVSSKSLIHIFAINSVLIIAILLLLWQRKKIFKM